MNSHVWNHLRGGPACTLSTPHGSVTIVFEKQFISNVLISLSPVRLYFYFNNNVIIRIYILNLYHHDFLCLSRHSRGRDIGSLVHTVTRVYPEGIHSGTPTYTKEICMFDL